MFNLSRPENAGTKRQEIRECSRQQICQTQSSAVVLYKRVRGFIVSPPLDVVLNTSYSKHPIVLFRGFISGDPATEHG